MVVVCLSVVVVVGVVVSGAFSFTTQNFFFPSFTFFLTAFFLQRGVVAGVVTGVAGVVAGVGSTVVGCSDVLGSADPDVLGSSDVLDSPDVMGCPAIPDSPDVLGSSDVLGCSKPVGQPWKNPLKGLNCPRKPGPGWFPSSRGKAWKDPGKPCEVEGSPLVPGTLLGLRAGKEVGKPCGACGKAWGACGEPWEVWKKLLGVC